MVQLLLPHSTKETINKADKDGRTSLYYACRNNNFKMVELLLPHCTKETINKAYKDGETCLYWACRNKDLKNLILNSFVKLEELQK